MIPKGSQAELCTCAPGDSVYDAAKRMTEARVGAICVMDGERLAGLLSERDVMTKVVLADKALRQLTVADVMKDPVAVREDTMSIDDALRLMVDNHIRHVPLLDGDGKVRAMLTMRRLLDYRLDQLRLENDSLAAFVMADGIGG